MEKGLGALVAIISGVITLAMVAVVFSKNANAAGVLQAGGSALSSVIGAAVSPVTQATGLNSFSSP